MDQKKILVIAPHMDDEVLGCGGTIVKYVAAGDEVFVCFIAHRVYNHKFNKKKNEIEKKHTLKAKEILGYKEAAFFDMDDERLDLSVQDILIALERHLLKIKPSVVYCPFKGDNHQDHRAVFDAARVALRPSAMTFVEKLLMYEVPSSTEQSPPIPENAFLPNYYVDIEASIDKKIKALECYETEKRAYPHPRSVEAIRVIAQKRGTEVSFKYAEAFMLLREKWE